MSGFIVIGDEMNSSNILDEIANNWMLYAVIFLITSHLLMAVLIVANPVNQDLEGLFGLPDSKKKFCSSVYYLDKREIDSFKAFSSGLLRMSLYCTKVLMHEKVIPLRAVESKMSGERRPGGR